MPENGSAFPFRFGVYEKVLPAADESAVLAAAAAAGYDFVELSIDPSPERLGRLSWDQARRRQLAEASQWHGVGIDVLTLSAHRESPWGSADAAVRRKADTLARETIDLAADLGAVCVQIAGYFAFEGPRSLTPRADFLAGLEVAARHAQERGVVLAIENVDGIDVTSVDDTLSLIADCPVDDVQVYVDVGNLAGNDRDVVAELRRAAPRTFCVQLKDARAGEFRRVDFGDGLVPFDAVFDHLVAETPARVSVEMWNDDNDPALAGRAADWVRRMWHDALDRRQAR